MSERSNDGVDLTGIWQGLYTYPEINRSVSFVATLIDLHGSFTGMTHEPCVFRDRPGTTLYANLAGHRQQHDVTFEKTYEAAGAGYDTVHYEGRLSSDGNEIEGRWTIAPIRSGTFLMIRSAGKTEARRRKAMARA
jgi:hypothetical protein